MADIHVHLTADEVDALKALAVPNARDPVSDGIKTKLQGAGLIRNVGARVQVTRQGRIRLARKQL